MMVHEESESVRGGGEEARRSRADGVMCPYICYCYTFLPNVTDRACHAMSLYSQAVATLLAWPPTSRAPCHFATPHFSLKTNCYYDTRCLFEGYHYIPDGFPPSHFLPVSLFCTSSPSLPISLQTPLVPLSYLPRGHYLWHSP
jgi:hypothetical protein